MVSNHGVEWLAGMPGGQRLVCDHAVQATRMQMSMEPLGITSSDTPCSVWPPARPHFSLTLAVTGKNGWMCCLPTSGLACASVPVSCRRTSQIVLAWSLAQSLAQSLDAGS